MSKSKKPAWLRQKIAEGYRHKAKSLMNPEQRELMLSVEQLKEAERQERARKTIEKAARDHRPVKRWQVPQWSHDGTLLWYSVTENGLHEFECNACRKLWRDQGQGLRRGFVEEANACLHIQKCAVAGSLPWVEQNFKGQDGETVYQPPDLYVQRETYRINDGIRDAAMRGIAARLAREQQRERDEAERTRLVSQLVEVVESLPTGEQGHIRRQIDEAMQILRGRPVPEHLPIIANLIAVLRHNRSAVHRENAVSALVDSLRPRPRPSQQGFYEDFRRMEMERLNLMEPPPMIVPRAYANRVLASNAKATPALPPAPPKPTGHKFSGKRKFKLEE